MTYRTQRQRGENGPSLGNGIGHDFFSASEGRNEMRRESILLRYALLLKALVLSCSSWRLTLQGLVRGFDRDRVSQVVSLDAFLFWRRCWDGQPLRRQAFDHGDEDGMNHGSRSQDKVCFSPLSIINGRPVVVQWWGDCHGSTIHTWFFYRLCVLNLYCT